MATIDNKQPRLLWGPKIPGHKHAQWLPGKNELSPRYWAAIKNRSDVKRWISLGWLVVDEAEKLKKPKKEKQQIEKVAKKLAIDLPAPPKPKATLSGFLIGEALPLIQSEEDRETLLAWAESDTRKKIAAAIADRLKDLENGGPA